ncbi:MAG: hypothetical protein WB626_07145, partial [Bacteroidota bacterium]
GLIAAGAFRRRQSAAQALGESRLAMAALALIPPAVLSLNAFRVTTCSPVQGLAWFLLIPAVSIWFSACLGIYAAAAWARPRTVFLTVFGGSLLYALLGGYLTPAVFSYNFFYGYFPGLTYDEELGIEAPLVLFRLGTAGLGALLLLCVRLRRRTALALCAAALVPVWIFRCELGLETTGTYLERRLGGLKETEHFRIVYPAGAIGGAELERLAAEHEFRLRQVLDALQLPGGERRFTSYLYGSADEKRRLIGAGATSIAKPWRGETHIALDAREPTLKHELVHVAAAPFGIPILQIGPSPALVEGLAMAVVWNWGNRTLHQYAAALRRNGRGAALREILSGGGFLGHTSSLSYVAAGSFCRFLMDGYGIRPLTRVYGTGDYREAFGRSREDLVREWEEYLDGIPPEAGESDRVAALFSRPPLAASICGRAVAAWNREAEEHLGNGNHARALALFEASFRRSGSMEAFGGYLRSAPGAGRQDIILRSLDSVSSGGELPGRILPLGILFGDALWAAGRREAADSLYGKVAEADFSEGHTEGALLRRALLRAGLPPEGITRLFASGGADSLRLRMLDSLGGGKDSPPLGLLRAQMLVRAGRFREAEKAAASIGGGSLTDRLESLRLRIAAGALYRAGDYQRARSAFWESLNGYATPHAEAAVRDWVERCEWMAAYTARTREGE